MLSANKQSVLLYAIFVGNEIIKWRRYVMGVMEELHIVSFIWLMILSTVGG